MWLFPSWLPSWPPPFPFLCPCASICSLTSSPSFLLFVFSVSPPTPSRRACCLRFYAKRRTLKRRPSHCWSTCAPCRTSCSCRRLSAIASIRMRGNAAWRQPRQWAPLHSSALHLADLYRYPRFDSSFTNISQSQSCSIDRMFHNITGLWAAEPEFKVFVWRQIYTSPSRCCCRCLQSEIWFMVWPIDYCSTPAAVDRRVMHCNPVLSICYAPKVIIFTFIYSLSKRESWREEPAFIPR